MRTLDTEADLDEGLAHLAAADPRLRPVIAASGRLPVRRAPAGFEGLARIVVSQQLSVPSAEAIWRKLNLAIPQLTPEAILSAPDPILRGAGLSSGKVRTLRAVADAAVSGLDLAGLAARPSEEAHAALTVVKGIGPWTADIYLLFCIGHADIFPAGDLALRKAMGAAFGNAVLPTITEAAATAEAWSPWRGVAAILFWAYYRTLAGREGVTA
ncbi:MAG: DNA-3-methyladenine glycosylase 2 family protein [Bauldia sp.]|nr:DNA-3-methyladenine glycosylase 2 family protein [Bauldia sp.]